MALKLIDRIITKQDKDKIPINVYLDLSKSFDTIDRIILLDKLKCHGVHGTNLNLFSSYPELKWLSFSFMLTIQPYQVQCTLNMFSNNKNEKS